MTDNAQFEWITVTAVVQAALYAADELLAEKLEFTTPLLRGYSAGNFLKGTIESVVILDNAAQSAALDLVFFDADPSGTTFTLNAAFAPADADLLKSIGAVTVTTYTEFSLNSMATKTATGIQFDPRTVPTVFGALITRGTPTYAAVTDITVRLGVRYSN